MVNDVNGLLLYSQYRWSQNPQLCSFTMWLGFEVCYLAILLNLPCQIFQFNRWESLSHVTNQKAFTGYKLFEENLHWEIISNCISKHLSISCCFHHYFIANELIIFLIISFCMCITPSCHINQGQFWFFRILFLYHQDANSKVPPPLALRQHVAL